MSRDLEVRQPLVLALSNTLRNTHSFSEAQSPHLFNNLEVTPFLNVLCAKGFYCGPLDDVIMLPQFPLFFHKAGRKTTSERLYQPREVVLCPD